MNLKPDDIIVLKFKQMLSCNTHNSIKAQWEDVKKNLGITNKILILDAEAEIGVLGSGE